MRPEDEISPSSEQSEAPAPAPEPERLTKRAPPAREQPEPSIKKKTPPPSKNDDEELAEEDTNLPEAEAPSIFETLVRKVFGDLPARVRDWIKKNGDKPIKSLHIRRFPILKTFNSLMNLLSLGKFGQIKKNLGFDDFMHLSLLIELEDGSKWVAEKNETNAVKPYEKNPKEELLAVKIPKGLTYNDLYGRALKKYGARRITVYKFDLYNCQRWVSDLLFASGLLTKAGKNFIMQDLRQLREDLPAFTKKVGNLTTDAGAFLNKFIQSIGFKGFKDGGIVGRNPMDDYPDSELA